MAIVTGVRKCWPLGTGLWYGGACLAILCSLILAVQNVHTAMMPMGLGYLASAADTVVLGTVTRQVSAWDTPHTAIHTDITVTVERVILGTPGSEVTFRVAGGIVGGMGMRTSNDAVFQDGERVIVFLDMAHEPGSVVGMQQGKFTVQENTVISEGQQMGLDDFIAAIRRAAR